MSASATLAPPVREPAARHVGGVSGLNQKPRACFFVKALVTAPGYARVADNVGTA